MKINFSVFLWKFILRAAPQTGLLLLEAARKLQNIFTSITRTDKIENNIFTGGKKKSITSYQQIVIDLFRNGNADI